MPRLPIRLVLFTLVGFGSSSAALQNIFQFPSFSNDNQTIKLFGNASVGNQSGIIDLTDRMGQSQNSGWVIYPNSIRLYDRVTGFAADFQSNFSFQIIPIIGTCRGDGLAFFIANASWAPNPGYKGRGMGIFSPDVGFHTQIVAVEFDTFQNDFDASDHHVGIDINSYKSQGSTVDWNLNSSMPLNGTAIIEYNSASKNLSCMLAYQNGTLNAFLPDIDLATVLPENVILGFSASTGDCSEEHRILSWSFSATIPNQTAPNRTSTTNTTGLQSPAANSKVPIIVISCLVPLLIIVIIIIMVAIKLKEKKKGKRVEEDMQEEEEDEVDGCVDVTMNFETGPRKFSYRELAAATNDFSKEGKLGQGGFGGVYRGTLSDTNEPVAVKRFSKGSSQGKKEYVAEVSVISRLRHRNLVRLIGWCHERGEFLLVYEYMEGGSVDSHLFNKKDCPVLSWAQRRKVALDLASAVLYLHEEWEQCVVHRDIKLSNVMVDSEFNARLGDFGLARLSNHGFAPRTTMVAGTMGYLAPECVFTGKANTQSDVYSFGIVLLEIATGRKASRPIGEKEAGLVDWVWEFYGSGYLMAAVDERLGSEFDEQEMERMMVVGLWCVHPDPESRPTMREAIRALNFQADTPSLPRKIPVPIYVQPLMIEPGPSLTNSSCGTTATSITVSSTDSAEAALLRSQG
ncbi:unnamed protein product [Victoria cruziana]